MRLFLSTLLMATLVATSTRTCAEPIAAPSIQGEMASLIGNYRKIIALSTIEPDDARARAAHMAGQMLFFENKRTEALLLRQVRDSLHQQDPAVLDGLLDEANHTRYADADRLALRHVLEMVAREPALPPQQQGRLLVTIKLLKRQRATFSQELEKVWAGNTTPLLSPQRQQWTRYVNDVVQAEPPDAVLQSLADRLPAPTSARPASSPASAASLTSAQTERAQELTGQHLPDKTVLLTFDDGPHPVYTPQILKTLAQYHVHAIFFQVGQNLGMRENGQAVLTHNQGVEKDIIDAGHAIGNHSYTHPVLSRLSEPAVDTEIDLTQALLDEAVPAGPARTGMFRAPYGARNDLVLSELAGRHLQSVLWNIDSLDWSDPVPESIVHRILQQLDKQGRGVVLMHDIHARSAEALPLLLAELTKRGYHFAHWDGHGVVPD